MAFCAENSLRRRLRPTSWEPLTSSSTSSAPPPPPTRLASPDAGRCPLSSLASRIRRSLARSSGSDSCPLLSCRSGLSTRRRLQPRRPAPHNGRIVRPASDPSRDLQLPFPLRRCVEKGRGPPMRWILKPFTTSACPSLPASLRLLNMTSVNRHFVYVCSPMWVRKHRFASTFFGALS